MAQEQLLKRPSELNQKQRTRIFDKVRDAVTKHYFDPKFNGTDWPAIANASRTQIITTEDPEAFELAMHDLVRQLGTSHTGFFHQSVRRVPARLAIGATFSRVEVPDGSRWIARDVHAGGPADAAGLRAGDILEAVNDKPILPPEQPTFAMGTDWSIEIRRGTEQLTFRVAVPIPRYQSQPYCEPTPVIVARLDGNVGYLKVSIFPGLLGLGVARDVDAAVAELSSCDQLILDLRGNLGGGLGVLRLMSYLTPGKIPIGYTLSRKRAESGYQKETLPKLTKLPTQLPNPVAIAFMTLRFGGRDSSVVLMSEGLGPQKWHGHVAILINEHTVSAGEMTAAFAAENKLATIIGVETAGRLIPGSGTKVGDGYMLIMPRAEYITWHGHRFEGRGVEPSVRAEIPASNGHEHGDSAIEIARAVLG